MVVKTRAFERDPERLRRASTRRTWHRVARRPLVHSGGPKPSGVLAKVVLNVEPAADGRLAVALRTASHRLRVTALCFFSFS